MESTLTISDSIETSLPFENKVVRVVSLSTAKITEIKPFKIRYSGSRYLKAFAKGFDPRQPAQSAQSDIGRDILQTVSSLLQLNVLVHKLYNSVGFCKKKTLN